MHNHLHRNVKQLCSTSVTCRVTHIRNLAISQENIFTIPSFYRDDQTIRQSATSSSTVLSTRNTNGYKILHFCDTVAGTLHIFNKR